jgi:succinoglycan biosynthesis transport protein ExoP
LDTYAGPLPRSLPGIARSDSLLHLAQFTKLLQRHLWLIGLCAVVAMVGAYGYAHTLPKTYTANGIITVEGDSFAIPELQGALRADNSPDPMPMVRTEVQALTSRALVAAVAAKLHLNADPEFNTALRPPSLVEQGKDMVGSFVARLLPHSSAPIAPAGSDENMLGSVSKSLSVFQDDRSLVISVAFTSYDPKLAANFVNALIDEYVQTRARRRVDANQGANRIMEQRIDQVRSDLANIEQQMRDLRSKSDLVELRASGSVGQQQVEELTTAAAKATLDRSQLEVSYERAAAAAKQGSSDTLATVLNSPTISRLRDQEAQASERMAELSSRYGADYPGVRSGAAQLASVHRQISDEAARIVASLEAQLRVARAQEADVLKQLDQARRAGVQSENARAQLDQLQQEATTRRNLYQTLLEREQQTAGQPAASETPDVRILSPAVPPSLPSGPNTKLASIVGGAGGVLLGSLLALTRIGSVRGFENAEEVMSATGLVVLGMFPRLLVRRDRGVLALQPSNTGAVGDDTEAMRIIRDRLRFTGRTGVPRCALFLSSASDAASFAAPIAAAFARVAAADGERVLLIEGNVQAPSLHLELGLNAGGQNALQDDETGLPAVLAGSDWRDVVMADSQLGLDLLLASGSTTDAHVRLSGPQFQNLLVEARAEYDLVVLYGSPASSSEAIALVQRADTAVLVIDGRIDQAATQEAVTRLSSVAPTPLVAVLLPRA